MATTIILEAIARVNADPAQKSINTLEQELEFLKERFKDLAVGDKEFEKVGNRIREVSSELKTLDERFEGLGIEQKGAAIVDSFNVIAGSIGAVTGTLVALGVESEELENVERRLLGLITVVSSLREVSNGLAGAQKTLIPLFGKVGNAIKAAFASNPIGVITVAVVALTAAIAGLIAAQDDEAESLEELNKRRAEGEAALRKEEEASLALIKARGATTIQIAEEELSIARRREEAAKQELARQQTANRFSEETIKARQDVVDATNAVAVAEATLNQARLKAGEEQKKTDKELSDAATKRAEDIAKAAAAELEARRVAEQSLVELYEQFPEFIGEGSKGQFEFNTELDRTNFLLNEQINLLFTLTNEYEDLGDQLEEIDFDAPVSFLSEEELDVLKSLRDARKTSLQLQLQDLRETYLEDLALFSGNEEVKSQLTEKYEKDRAKLRRIYAIQTAQEIVGITSQFLTVIADINQQNLELQLAQARGNEQAIEQINKAALERQKKLRIAQTLITTAESILNAYNATSTLPPPFNFIAGSILAASYTALGAKTIQTIQSTTLDGGSTPGGFNNIPGGGATFSLQGGATANVPSPFTNTLPGLGGGRVATPTVGTINEAQEPIRAYVVAGDVENGLAANVALNSRRRLAGG